MFQFSHYSKQYARVKHMCGIQKLPVLQMLLLSFAVFINGFKMVYQNDWYKAGHDCIKTQGQLCVYVFDWPRRLILGIAVKQFSI